ncbi:UDP-glucose/GDP-mannose dehydrogenase family protein [Paenibacillus thermoaerophilus]|nr:UDP-glucose/GDP-mannose dehydrogenase family protein [Paenibacillus thermoaerophilus]
MNVVCIGSGYVGSVTGAALAAVGHPTTVVDVDERKVALLRQGKSPIYEPGLESLIQALIGKTLFADTSYEPVRTADVVFIAVGTPSKKDGTADLVHIREAAAGIGRHLDPDRFTVIVNKSTVPVGTAGLVASVIERETGLKAERHFTVVSNPEFLREGYALEDVFFPDRIVIGSSHPVGLQRMRELYSPWMQRSGYERFAKHFRFEVDPSRPLPKYFETDCSSSEMIKYAANAFLAVKISYINEIARLCEALGSNVKDVAAGMGMDTRIGDKFLEVSSGWSGSCFPKDTAELLATSEKYGIELSVVRSSVQSNRQMHDYVVQKLRRQLKSMNGRTVGIWGVTFKPNTDDARQTQAAHIVRELLDLGAYVQVHDPQGMAMFREMNPDLPIRYCESAYEAADRADAVILLTHWREYGQLRWEEVAARMNRLYVLDTRNMLDSERLWQYRIQVEGLGNSQRASGSGQAAVIPDPDSGSPERVRELIG